MADDTHRALDAKIRDLMRTHRVPGVAVGVLADGEEHWACHGVTSLENPLPVTPETLFQIGSTTKTVTGTALIRLAEQGRLDLDAPVCSLLPLKLTDEGVARRVTTRHLLTHTAGWVGDYFEDTGWGDDATARYVEKMASLPQLTPLGEIWSYNNAAFNLAGRVVEVITGKAFEAAVTELVLEPLGMRDSLFFAHDVMLRRFVVGHVVREHETVIARPWPIHRNSHAAGGISSSVRDQLRYARFHLGDGRTESGTRVLSELALKSMQTPSVPAASEGLMGLSWMLRDIEGVRTVYHGGATNGHMSAFWTVPDRGFAFTSLTNADKGGELNSELSTWVRKHYLGIVEPEPVPVHWGAEQLAAYAGEYEMAGMKQVLALSVEGDGLLVRTVDLDVSSFTDTPSDPPPPAHIKPYAPDRFVILDGPGKGRKLEFLRDGDGQLAWLRLSRIYRRLRL
jgi:CubicO group peptidase (beta-lactamase class C family)